MCSRSALSMFAGLSRRFSVSSRGRSDITKLNLTEALRNNHVYSSQDNFVEDKSAKITTLPNGLRVASVNKLGSQCAIGVIVKAGPRFEVNSPSGVSHFLEKLGFHSTLSFSDRNAIQEVMEQCNAIFDCQIARDFIIYATSGFNTNMAKLTNILAETVLHPRMTNDEIEMARRSISFELQTLQRSPPVEPLLSDLIHAAAFRGNNTLGLPRYCPEENLDKIGRDDIVRFVTTYYRPDRMVVAGVGINHDEFVKAVEESFLPTEHDLSSDKAAQTAPKPDLSVAQYTGGCVTLERDLSQYHAPMPEFAHAAIALESCGYNDPQFVTACLLHSLLGGGGSFSAGGPGKGMYTRLYLNVLNEYHWVNSAQAENHAYADTGLFTITGSSTPQFLDRLVYVLVDEIRRIVELPIETEELSRAKHQLQSMLLMNLEMRAVSFEDIARQVLTTGVRREPEYWVERINKVSVSDLTDLAQRMITQSAPTLIGFGQTAKLPQLSDVARALAEPLGNNSRLRRHMPKLFKQFI